MKILKFWGYVFALFLMLGCEAETQKPLFSGQAPNAVTQYSVENLPGAAAISFKLTDANTAYVKAVYTLKEGMTREAKSSKYDNKLIVNGFAEAREYSVALYAVGADEQESEPIHITVNPGPPPYKTVVENMDVNPDWGGGKLKGANETSAKLLIGVLRKDPATGKWLDVDVFFTEGQSFDFNFRNLGPIETEFGVYSRDQWQNFSDTLLYTFAPWEEIKLPLSHNALSHFLVLPGDAIGQASYGLRKLFDGLKGPWTNGYYSVNDGTPFPKTITIDLLDTYQLSRFKLWQNSNLFYQSANAKHIRIWGNSTPSTDYSTWQLLGEWDNWRPSGRPPATGNGGLTDEDLLAGNNGNDFDFPLDAPAVRYIRIEAVTTFEPRTQVYYTELEFWGRKVE